MIPVEPTSEPTGGGAPTVRALVLHTTTAMIAASILTIILHESAHAVVGMTLGIPSRTYPFAAMPVTEVSRETDTSVMLAGPAFSLVLGLVLSFLIRPSRKPGSAYLCGVWLASSSLLEGSPGMGTEHVGGRIRRWPRHRSVARDSLRATDRAARSCPGSAASARAVVLPVDDRRGGRDRVVLCLDAALRDQP